MNNKRILWILRHGQAMHNVRAEVARHNDGCTFDEFLNLMKQDDVFDAPLTQLGIEQAQNVYTTYFNTNKNNDISLLPNIIISSPLSRAIDTADYAMPIGIIQQDQQSNQQQQTQKPIIKKRICYEGLREINGYLYNAQRKTKSDLQILYPHWDFSSIENDNDTLWTTQLEDTTHCAYRALYSLQWICQTTGTTSTSSTTSTTSTSFDSNNNNQIENNDNDRILLVAHGGLLKYMMELSVQQVPVVQQDDTNENQQQTEQQRQQQQSTTIKETVTNIKNKSLVPKLIMKDERTNIVDESSVSIVRRFENCELRKYYLEYHTDSSTDTTTTTTIGGTGSVPTSQSIITLTEIDI